MQMFIAEKVIKNDMISFKFKLERNGSRGALFSMQNVLVPHLVFQQSVL